MPGSRRGQSRWEACLGDGTHLPVATMCEMKIGWSWLRPAPRPGDRGRGEQAGDMGSRGGVPAQPLLARSPGSPSDVVQVDFLGGSPGGGCRGKRGERVWRNLRERPGPSAAHGVTVHPRCPRSGQGDAGGYGAAQWAHSSWVRLPVEVCGLGQGSANRSHVPSPAHCYFLYNL